MNTARFSSTSEATAWLQNLSKPCFAMLRVILRRRSATHVTQKRDCKLAGHLDEAKRGAIRGSTQRIATCVALLLPLLGCTQETHPKFENWEEALAAGGLAAAQESLEAQDQTAETAFLLGGVQFLRAFESVFQVRYSNFGAVLPMVPGMLNELPPNPDAAFDPMFIETAMARALIHLSAAESTLKTAVSGEFGVEVNLRDFWFDIDADSERDSWEGLIDILIALNARPSVAEFDGIIRFDTADADWLKAYVHAVSAMAEFTLSLDPTPAIRTVYEGRTALDNLAAVADTPFIGDDIALDVAGAALLTFRGVPDGERTRATHAHFKAMIAHNRKFWDKVEQETDNDNEWLPNARQTAAFGLAVESGTALAWRGFLDEINAILDGDLLIPYWRLPQSPDAEVGVGLNLRRILEDPPDMDIVLWIQGTAAVPYLEQGPLADMAAWGQFMSMTPGNSLLFAIWFN